MKWSYQIDDQAKGPVSLDVLNDLYEHGDISGETLLMREDFEAWRPLSEYLTYVDGRLQPRAKMLQQEILPAGDSAPVDEQVCEHCGKLCPEHLMIKTPTGWIARDHLQDYHTQFITRKKARTVWIRGAVFGLLIVACAAAGYHFRENLKETYLNLREKWQTRQDQSKPAPKPKASAGKAEGNIPQFIDEELERRQKMAEISRPVTGRGPEDVHPSATIENASVPSMSEATRQSKIAEMNQDVSKAFGLDPSEVATDAAARQALVSETSDWVKKPLADWPQILLVNHIELRRGGIFVGGGGFLIKSYDDRIVGVGDASLFGTDGNDEASRRILGSLPGNIDVWKLYRPKEQGVSLTFDGVLGGEKSATEQAVALGGRVFLRRASPPTSLPGTPVALSKGVPGLGETVFILTSRVSPGSVFPSGEVGVLVKVDRVSRDLEIGIPPSASASKLGGSPVIDGSGVLIGIITGPSPLDLPLQRAGYGKYHAVGSLNLARMISDLESRK